VKTSRQRLLEYLQNHCPISAAELSQALRMTEANARHHLGILKHQGLVEVIGKRPTPGKGRPQLLYSLSEQILGDNLSNLANALLEELLADLSAVEQKKMLKRVARRMTAPSPPSHSQPASLTQRLFNTVQQLITWHYQARWEAHADGPRLVLGNCPYAAILPGHPELCTLEALILERMLGKPVEQILHPDRDARGLPHCVFRLVQ
jgi:predicted ArsR family transcriptional regulator